MGIEPRCCLTSLKHQYRAVALALAVTSAVPALARADTCYRDENGQILNRRLPGTTEVPCPADKLDLPNTPASTAPAPGSATAPGSNTGPEQNPQGSGEGFDRGPPPAASPIPQPGRSDYVDSVPMPDRWRIVDALGYQSNLLDPYNRNPLKADKPLYGDWFLNLSVLSDSVYEYRNLASAVGTSSTERAGSNDVFGHSGGSAWSENVATGLTVYEGDTTFRPPDWEFRFTPVFNFNYAKVDEGGILNVDPRDASSRSDGFVGIQDAFVEKHLRNVSDRYDFDSVRIGIQPFSTDFRGFLFQDNQLGIRFFGTRDNNIFQYNLAYFRRLEKDTNSGLNDLEQPLRHDDVVIANLYWQDMPVHGFVSQATVVYNHNTEGGSEYYDSNGFLVRPAPIGLELPHNYDVVYLGYNGDGHFGRTNLTGSFYYATGHENPGVFVDSNVQISAAFAALELSRDFDWIRTRLSMLYGSGDRNPYDRKATGFDAIFENPQFAGGDTSYWISQGIPLIGGGGVSLSQPNGVLASLRSSKDEGQSNFDNPGLILLGLGADLDLLPTLRLTVNVNDLRFASTAVISALRNQPLTSDHIGEDASTSLTFRPKMTQNVVLRAAYARLFAASGYDALFPQTNPNYFLLNVVLAY
jgi:hypothetical protein